MQCYIFALHRKNTFTCIMHDELLLSSWRLTMSEEGVLSVRFREPQTFCEEEELVEKSVPSSTKYKNKWAGPCQFLVNGNLLRR